MYTDIHFIFLPLGSAFRAQLQSENLFVSCLNPCDVPSTVLGALKII